MYQTHVFSNGLRLIHLRVPAQAAYCALIINTGSRDEQPDEAGIAHFIEHVIFKGTRRRKAYHILSRMEDVGGELNAYTTKEDTCVYATFLPAHYERAVELFADIVFHSTFPDKEIEKEKDVVLDEINSYKDNPGELIFDDFEELVYANHPIGRNILGDEEAIHRLTRGQLLRFVERNYTPDRMVVSSVGDIPFDRLTRIVERHLAHYPSGPTPLPRLKPDHYVPRRLSLHRDTHQVHCIIGNTAYDSNDDKRLPLSLLTNLLGGSGMNTRLNLNIRERYGIAYNIEAAYTPYSDTGVFTVYFGCDPENAPRCLELCTREMQRLRREPLGPVQLKRAKTQMIGQLTISSENHENLMLSIGKSFLLYDKVDDMEEVYRQIREITPETLLQVADETFDPDHLSILTYK